MDDDEMISVDPYDMLQEHNLLINRLITAHNKNEKVVAAMSQHSEALTKCLKDCETRLIRAERTIRELKENK